MIFLRLLYNTKREFWEFSSDCSIIVDNSRYSFLYCICLSGFIWRDTQKLLVEHVSMNNFFLCIRWYETSDLESYLIVHVCVRAVSIHMSCLAWSIVPPCGGRLRSLSWVCWIVLFAVRKGCVRVNFVVWGTDERLFSCTCSIRFITENHPMNGYLNNFIAARNARASATCAYWGLSLIFFFFYYFNFFLCIACLVSWFRSRSGSYGYLGTHYEPNSMFLILCSK